MEVTPDPTRPVRPGPSRIPWKLALIVAALMVVFAMSRLADVQGALRGALEWIEGLGLVGAVVYIVLYILACVFLVPGTILSLGAGAIYGVVKGVLLTSIASTLGATAAFLVGRYLARDWVASRIAGNPRFEAIDRAVAKEGWKIVGLTRLSPVFPFNVLNYVYGLTPVSLRDYFFASWIGMLPGTFLYVYLGAAAGEIAALGGETERTPAQYALLALGLAATVAVTVLITRLARNALKQQVGG